MRRPGCCFIFSLVLIALPAKLYAAEDMTAHTGLQPYKMVRSLQLVQDRLAGGDHAALPMQSKLLELIDARFRHADSNIFAERRNFDALMIYAMSGGNPTTIAVSLGGLSLDEADSAASSGVLAYLAGDLASARDAMATITHSDYPQEVAAFLALVKGSVIAAEDALAGMATLDQARLLAPGTLVEEAALRRILSLCVSENDGERFMQASEQYARRFLRSPYAAQFAETFVSGVISLRKSLDLTRITAAIAWMTQEQAETVYLRLARRAAIDGDVELLDFASQRGTGQNVAASGATDPRKQLYSGISSVTSETVSEAEAWLAGLDASQLSLADRALLEAARTVAQEVLAPVDVNSRQPYAESANNAAAPMIKSTTTEIDPRVLAVRTQLEKIDRMLEESEP